MLVEFGRSLVTFDNKLTNIGHFFGELCQILANVGQHRPKIGRNRPMLVESRPDLGSRARHISKTSLSVERRSAARDACKRKCVRSNASPRCALKDPPSPTGARGAASTRRSALPAHMNNTTDAAKDTHIHTCRNLLRHLSTRKRSPDPPRCLTAPLGPHSTIHQTRICYHVEPPEFRRCASICAQLRIGPHRQELPTS